MSAYQGSAPPMPGQAGRPAVAGDPGRDAPARLGRYELIGQLATGGMAEIHLARLAGEGGFEKIVVVKRLLPELVASPAYVAMFLDEGKLVSRLDHPNICEVHELGRDGAEYYLAMPYLDGIAVHELIARPRDPDRIGQLRVATGVIVQACAGLHHAHELRDADGGPAGLVHRDVSPSNLFVTAAGIVKVLDFGIAKVRGAAETEVGTIKGKQQYMAPEQLLGEALDRRCDVFALGIVLYELATHQRLFKRASDYLTARAVLEEPIPRAETIDPAVPAALADVIARALARDPDARYATAAELGAAVEAAMTAHGGVAAAQAIAAAVSSTDELSQLRTRQARVLDAAKSRVDPETQLDAAPTRPLRGTRDDAVTERAPRQLHDVQRQQRARRIALGVGVLATLVLAGAIGVIAGLGDDSHHGEASVGAAPGAASDDLAPGGTVAGPSGGAPGDDVTRGGVSPANPGASAKPPGESAAKPPSESSTKPPAEASTPPPGETSTKAPAVTSPPGEASAKPAGEASAKPSAERARPRAKGQFSIDSTPYATIFINGDRIGVTPLVKRTLPAGRHTLRAVLASGRSRELTIDVPANALAKPIQLTW